VAVLTNAYTTTASVAQALGISDSDDDGRIDDAIKAASRQIDDHCGRKFWQDTDVVVRTYFPDTSHTVVVDDISTTTGLIVKIDDDDDGTYETTLTINTDFIVEPINAAAEYPVRPYTWLTMVDNYTFPRWGRRPSVQVTARFGWPAVPDEVTKACRIQAKNLYKADAGTFSGFQLSAEAGIVMRTPGLDPVARDLLESYRRVWIG